MRAAGVFADDTTLLSDVHLWQVEGVVLTIPDAVDLLLALAQPGCRR
jgi:hypothetical protein